MRHLHVLSLSLCLLVSPAQAERWRKHRFEIDATAGYRFGGAHEVDMELDTGPSVPGRLTMAGSFSWGGLLAYRIQKNGTVFFSYSRQDSEFRFRVADLNVSAQPVGDLTGDGSIEYFQLGGTLHTQYLALVPYFGASVGITRFDAEGASAEGRFNFTLETGVRFELVPFLDLRVLARLPITFPSSVLFCFADRGCAEVANNSPFLQGELQLGAGLRF